MATPNDWLLQIYLMSDETSQALVLAFLTETDGLAVEIATNDINHYIVVETTNIAMAVTIEGLVTSVDPGAVLMHTSDHTIHPPLLPD